jgi:hypothetical protein
MEPLHELLYLLSCHVLEGDELDACAAAVRSADSNADYDWMEEADERREFAVRSELNDWVAEGDKVDELHEGISDGFEDPLPPYPYHDDDRDFPPPAYFRWLDGVLAQRGPGYELLLWNNPYTEDLYAMSVRRADMPRILELSHALGFSPSRATDMFSF